MLFLCCIVLIGCASFASGDTSVIVHTNYGDIEGYETDLARVFYAIPYAQPPVDRLRLIFICVEGCVNIFVLLDGNSQYLLINGLQKY